MQNQGGTEFANLHREVQKLSDSSRDTAQKMAQMQVTAKKMESEYRALLEQAVHDPNTGRQYLPNMTQILLEQFGVLENELRAEKDANQQLIYAANQVVTDCNDAMTHRYGSKVVPKRKQTAAARSTHKQCRDTEYATIADRDTKCISPTYYNHDNPSSTSENMHHYENHNAGEEDSTVEICKGNQDYYTNPNPGDLAWYGAEGNYGADTGFAPSVDLDAAIEQANACVAHLEHGKQCDRDQSTFEVTFCLYSQELRDTCADHDTCYAAALSDRDATVADVTQLEKEQKLVWISLQKIFCYVNHLNALQQSGDNPTQADITECVNLDPSTEPLNLIKPAADAKTPCDKSTVTFQPGDAKWAEQEGYGGAIPSPPPAASWKLASTPAAPRSEDYSTYIELEPVVACDYHVGGWTTGANPVGV